MSKQERIVWNSKAQRSAAPISEKQICTIADKRENLALIERRTLDTANHNIQFTSPHRIQNSDQASDWMV
jgi:hypothetical protein